MSRLLKLFKLPTKAKSPGMLLAVSLLCGILWRFEVEAHGWSGLTWLSYTHLAIAAGVQIFLIWLWNASPFSLPTRRVGFVVASAAWLLGGGLILQILVRAYFDSGPQSISWNVVLGESFTHQLSWVGPLGWIIFPVPLFALWSFFLRMERKGLVLGTIIWSLCWHFGLLMLFMLSERGDEDLIHALKTGWMIPFAVFGLGFPILFSKDKSIAANPNLDSNFTSP